MNTGLISTRYAKALLSSAEEKGEGRVIYDAFVMLLGVVDANRNFLIMLKNPMLSQAQKRQFLLVAAGTPKSKLYESFLSLLLRNGREEYIQRIAFSYVDLYLNEKKKCLAKVKSAIALNEIERERIIDILQIHTGRDVELQMSVDPELIGGFVIDLGDERLDLSLVSQLKRLKKNI